MRIATNGRTGEEKKDEIEIFILIPEKEYSGVGIRIF